MREKGQTGAYNSSRKVRVKEKGEQFHLIRRKFIFSSSRGKEGGEGGFFGYGEVGGRRKSARASRGRRKRKMMALKAGKR